MEFKGYKSSNQGSGSIVDIGTEWNLKERACCTFTAHLQVDIGTEWNLKRERLTADPALVREQSGI